MLFLNVHYKDGVQLSSETFSFRFVFFYWAVGGDITFNFGPFHFTEVATKTRYYSVSSDTLIYAGQQ